MKPLERELELTSRALLAAEDWAPTYANAPKQHTEMIKAAATFQRLTLQYLNDLANDSGRLIDWYAYARAVIEQRQNLRTSSVQAYDVNVIINQDGVNQQDANFIKIVFDTVTTIQSLGADSMAAEYGFPIGLTSTSAIIQQLTTEQLANLVGMKVIDKGLPTEHIIPNPNAAMNIDETTRGRIARSIQTSIQLGEDQRAAAKRLGEIIADADRADLIAYTETVRAYAEGRAEYARQAGMEWKQWYIANAIDVCADNAAEGPIPAIADFVSGDPNEPAHPHCLVAGTVVSSPTVQATSKRLYKGRIVTITTAAGHKLTVTPNHPILTGHGWTAAGDLQHGMDIVSSSNAEWVTSSVDPNDYNIPAPIENIIKSFKRTLAMSTIAMPTTAEDFHGDGIDGEVAVIFSNRLLGNRRMPQTLQPFLHLPFKRTYAELLAFTSKRGPFKTFNRLFRATNSIMRSPSPILALFGSAFTNMQPVGNGNITNGHIALKEKVFKSSPATFPLARKLLDRFPSLITLDEIIGISEHNFAGHVYNLETSTGWYIADGIVTHNCQCQVRYASTPGGF